MQHYENTGKSGFMTASLNDELWTFTGDTLRFNGKFSLDYNIFLGLWEQHIDGKTWADFMKVTLVKIKHR